MKILKRFGPLVLFIAIGFFLVPDEATFRVTVIRLAVSGLVLMLAIATIGFSDEWGLFPDLDIPELCLRSRTTPEGAAIVLLGLLILLASIVFAVAH